MIRIMAGFFVVMVMISAGTVYSLKETAQRLELRKKQLSAQILTDRNAIKVLRAEMAYLSQPDRLQQLSRRFLALGPMRSDQMARSVNSIARRAEFSLTFLPMDEFPLLLPRSKPPYQSEKYDLKPAMVSQRKKTVKKDEGSFYERISLKIEGSE